MTWKFPVFQWNNSFVARRIFEKTMRGFAKRPFRQDGLGHVYSSGDRKKDAKVVTGRQIRLTEPPGVLGSLVPSA